MKRIMTCMLMAFAIAAATLMPAKALDHLVWRTEGGKQYWYENGTRQGVPGDPKNIWETVYGVERGREIYDPASNGWYWLDAVYGGAKAANKEVWMPYIFQEDMAKGINKQGKWVRYNGDGKMIKGWYTPVGSDADLYPDQVGNIYYYDLITGEMVKGNYMIDNINCHFDEITGVLKVPLTYLTYPEDLYNFVFRFWYGYSFQEDYENMFYSSANPAVNSDNIVCHLIADFFISCVDHELYPGEEPKHCIDADDPYGWFSFGYHQYDGYNIDWIGENVLNLSEPDFDALFEQTVKKKTCYRLYYSSEPYDYDYFVGVHNFGLDGPSPEFKILNITGYGRIRVVEYGEYIYDIEKGEFPTVPTRIYRCFLIRKEYGSTSYWSIFGHGRIS